MIGKAHSVGCSVGFKPDVERFTDQTMKRSTIQRLAITLAIVALILIQAYLESSIGFTPNH